jgi:hypothetical protein
MNATNTTSYNFLNSELTHNNKTHDLNNEIEMKNIYPLFSKWTTDCKGHMFLPTIDSMLQISVANHTQAGATNPKKRVSLIA